MAVVQFSAMKDSFFPGATAQRRPGLPREVYRSQTMTLHGRHDYSGQGIGRSLRPQLTTHNTHKRQTFIHPAGLEPAIPKSDRPQTLTSEPSANGIGKLFDC